jgi:tetratricopeptide (TPR) repeat protein
MKNYQDALADINQVIILEEEKDKDLYSKRSEIYASMRMYQEALADINHAISLDGENADLFARRAEVFGKMRNFQDALADANKAISLADKGRKLFFIIGRVTLYLLMERFQDALADANQVISLGGEKYYSFAIRALIYNSMQNYQEALADINHAISLDEKNADLFAQRAGFYRDMQNYQEALADINHAISLEVVKTNKRMIDKGLILSYLRRYDEAIECYEAGLKENPNNHNLLYNLAVTKARLNGYSNADTQIKSARDALLVIIDTKDRSRALYGLGGLEAIEGKYTEALNYLEQAVKLDNHWAPMASQDIAWLELHSDAHFQSIISNFQ